MKTRQNGSASLKQLSCKCGFSLVEIMVSLGCASLALMVLVSLTLVSNRSQLRAIGNQEAIDQRSEIRTLLFQKPRGLTSSTCLARLGTPSSAVFNPSSDFDLTNLAYTASNPRVTLNRTFLTRAVLISPTGSNPIYSAQLVVEQSLNEGQTPTSLPRSLLGSMYLQVDSGGHITGCNWDINPSSLSGCSGIAGLSGSSTGPSTPCYNDFALASIGSCPYGTNFNSAASTCVPADMGCTADSVAHNFDGTKFDCTVVPPVYAVRYPAAYTPPNSNQNNPSVGGPVAGAPSIPIPPTQSAPPVTGAPSTPITPPNPTPPLTCTCGSATFQAGSSQLCVRAYTNSEGFGNYDDMFEVKVCNSVGALVAASPTHYFNEDGQGDSWSFRPGTCTLFGGYKNENGIHYSRGRCL